MTFTEQAWFRRAAVAALIVGALFGWFTAEWGFFPRCQEDEVIVGMGDFRDGLWDGYQCVPFDNMALTPST